MGVGQSSRRQRNASFQGLPMPRRRGCGQKARDKSRASVHYSGPQPLQMKEQSQLQARMCSIRVTISALSRALSLALVYGRWVTHIPHIDNNNQHSVLRLLSLVRKFPDYCDFAHRSELRTRLLAMHQASIRYAPGIPVFSAPPDTIQIVQLVHPSQLAQMPEYCTDTTCYFNTPSTSNTAFSGSTGRYSLSAAHSVCSGFQTKHAKSPSLQS